MQTASVKWIDEQKFMATSPSGHAVTIDSDRESNKAPGPMELLLVALGACTATDVVIILEKKRQKLDALEVIAVIVAREDDSEGTLQTTKKLAVIP